MLCLVRGKRLRDGISNQTIGCTTGVKKIEELMKEQRLSWFEHVENMDNKRTPVKVKHFVVDGSKKGRL